MFNDIILELLEVAFHSLLFYSNIYPSQIFDSRKKYGAPVKYSLHPDLNSYISGCLDSIKCLLDSDCLDKVSFCILDRENVQVRRFTFVVRRDGGGPSDDHYLVRCEQNLRAFCLKLANCEVFAEPPPDGATFTIMLFTTENGAVKLAKNPQLEHFPFVEQEEDAVSNVREDDYHILPIRTINIDEGLLQIYAEHLPP